MLNPVIETKLASVPPWWVFHVPHDATAIPIEVRDQFLLTDELLNLELARMTDHHTFELFAVDVPRQQVVRAPVSRLVVDVERFEHDDEEPLSAIGMGAIYRVTHDLRPLRRSLAAAEREALLDHWYRPHHSALASAVDLAVSAFGRALVIDAHSYPSKALPYETDAKARRPEICIGTDAFHTPTDFVDSLQHEFAALGFETAINTPFAGALVPATYYRRDTRVISVMIELRRDLYMDESTCRLNERSIDVAIRLRKGLVNAWLSRERIEDSDRHKTEGSPP